MSTYEEDHNIASETRPSESDENNGERQTLESLLELFFERNDDISDESRSRLRAEVSRFPNLFSRSFDLSNDSLSGSLFEQLRTQKDDDGVSQEYIDALERVPLKSLKLDQTCSICTNDFLDDPHPLVVKLNCEGKHKFDLECIAPWLKAHSTCPLCRKNLLDKKVFDDLPEDDEEEDDDRDMYG